MATRSIVSEVSKESLTCDKPGWTIGLKCRDCPARLRNPKPAARKPWDTLLAKSHPRAQRSRGFFSDSSLESCSLSLGTLGASLLGFLLDADGLPLAVKFVRPCQREVSGKLATDRLSLEGHCHVCTVEVPIDDNPPPPRP